MKLSDPVSKLSGVGEKNAKKLARLDIFDIASLLHHFPSRYDDLSKITPIAEVKPGESYTIKAKIKKKNSRPAFRFHGGLTEILVDDGTASLVIIWFNQSYLNEILQVGRTYLFSGSVGFYKTLQMQNPIWELDKPQTLHTGRIVPVYPLTAGVFPKWLRSLLKQALDKVGKLSEFLPETIIKNQKLLEYDTAVRSIHFPENQNRLAQAKKRLAFNELLFHEIKVLTNRKNLRSAPSRPLPFDKKIIKDFVIQLPFQLTLGQKLAAWDILKDIGRDHPANRLLSGDVGSGKTIIAAMAILQALNAKSSSALMVPTEILAQQHFETFCHLPDFGDFPIALLTSSAAMCLEHGERKKLEKKKLLDLVKRQKIPLLIGTQALIQKNVSLESLGLVVVDEQHRFGVEQRGQLRRGVTGIVPHFLSMTATPIPRTLALSLYGDLDISNIKELPLGRRPVETVLVKPSERKDVYEKIDAQITVGRQVFIICPLIDPSDKLGFKSATEEYERLKESDFRHRRLGLLHGKMKSAEKEQVLRDFGARKIDVLVSTTVVEVGIDFPNATVMMIEGAERFGLAQLHQLRGRVGRSDLQSYCYLLPQNLSERSKQRLQAVVEHHNGLELAEIDLKLRGPGEVYGNLQSGYPQFKIADVFDLELLEAAKKEAKDLIETLDSARYPLLSKKIASIQSSLHLE